MNDLRTEIELLCLLLALDFKVELSIHISYQGNINFHDTTPKHITFIKMSFTLKILKVNTCLKYSSPKT